MKFLLDESGPTSTEYAVMIAAIVVICLAACLFLGGTASRSFSSVGTTMSGS